MNIGISIFLGEICFDFSAGLHCIFTHLCPLSSLKFPKEYFLENTQLLNFWIDIKLLFFRFNFLQGPFVVRIEGLKLKTGNFGNDGAWAQCVKCAQCAPCVQCAECAQCKQCTMYLGRSNICGEFSIEYWERYHENCPSTTGKTTYIWIRQNWKEVQQYVVEATTITGSLNSRQFWALAYSYWTMDSTMKAMIVLVLFWALSPSSGILWCTFIMKKTFTQNLWVCKDLFDNV